MMTTLDALRSEIDSKLCQAQKEFEGERKHLITIILSNPETALHFINVCDEVCFQHDGTIGIVKDKIAGFHFVSRKVYNALQKHLEASETWAKDPSTGWWKTELKG